MFFLFDKNFKNLVLSLVILTGLMISSPLMAPYQDAQGMWHDGNAPDSTFQYPSSGQQNQRPSGRPQPQASGGGFAALSAPQTVKLSYEGPETGLPNFGGRPSAGSSSSLPSTQLFGRPSSSGSSGGYQGGAAPNPFLTSSPFVQSSSLQRPNYTSTFQSGGLAQLPPSSSFYPQSSSQQPYRPSQLTASSLASLSKFQQPYSPISAADADAFSTIGDGTRSEFGDLGDLDLENYGNSGPGGNQKRQFTAFPVQPQPLKPGQPVIVPPGTVDSSKLINTIQKTDQKSGFFGNIMASGKNASVVKGLAAGDKTDAKYENSQIDYQGQVLTADQKKSLVKDAKEVSKFLNAFFGQTTRTDETFRQLTGNLSSYVQKLKNNVRETQSNFVGLFYNIDATFGQSQYHDQLVALKNYTMNFFEQIINEYDRILSTADDSIQAVNEQIANFGQEFRTLQAEVDKALSINASESVLMSVVDKLLSINFFNRN